jgi:ribosomal-protein-alanine N-acetyltransferase
VEAAARMFGGLTPESLSIPIGTRRLILRRPTRNDLRAVCRIVNDPSIAFNVGTIRYAYPPISGWRWLSSQGRIENGAFHIAYLLTLRSNPRHFAGAAGITVRSGGPPEIGYWLGRDYRRKGFAAEATGALIARIFTESDAPAVVATARTTNVASQRVLLAAGMTRVGYRRGMILQLGRYVPLLLYRIDRQMWEKRKRPAL